MSLGNNTITKKPTCVCISCFNYYDTRMKQITEFFRRKGYEVIYVTSDFNHFEKRRFKVDYPDTIQVHVPVYKKNISIQMSLMTRRALTVSRARAHSLCAALRAITSMWSVCPLRRFPASLRSLSVLWQDRRST